MRFSKPILQTIEKYSKNPKGCGDISGGNCGICPLWISNTCFIQNRFQDEVIKLDNGLLNKTSLSGTNVRIERLIHLVCKNIMTRLKIKEIMK